VPTVAPRIRELPDRLVRKGVWSVALILILVAAGWYAKKANDGNSAFVRWRPQVLAFWSGVNVYDKQMFPNPPIMPLTLLPLMLLPTVVGAMVWFAFKAVLAAASARMCFRMAEAVPGWRISPWAEGLVLLLSLRPILSDLHHGNNNLVILFLVVASLYAWRQGYDVLAGMALALAITYKVTPALFVPYFLYKRSWRTAGATCLGVGIFLLAVPSLFIGAEFNGQCLGMWWHRILSPYLASNEFSPQEINQSMVGVLSRLLTAPKEAGRYTVEHHLNLVNWDRQFVGRLCKVISLALVALLAFLCRTRARRRDDARLLGEFSLVVLTMLFVSERSWKHHFVTMMLPFTFLIAAAYSATLPRRAQLAATVGVWLAAFLMATTSSEIGSVLWGSGGHKVAQFYGMFLWAGAVLYVATAWRVRADRLNEPSRTPTAHDHPPAPHLSGAPAREGAHAGGDPVSAS